jgi:pimeloyl-ACP methyl ester carboxylesterase
VGIPGGRTGLLIIAAVLLATACSDGSAPNGPAAVMTVDPSDAPTDVPVAVSIRGLPAGAKTTVQASATDAKGRKWTSSAEFTADSAGTVSLDRPATGGSYRGANAMGLFESLSTGDSDPDGEFRIGGAGFDVRLQAEVDGEPRATTVVHRHTSSPVVTRKELRPATDDGLYGDVYLPTKSTGKRPALLVISGGEGGLSTTATAGALAARGYPSLALAYFAESGLPPELGEIPLEYFGKALTLLRKQKGVDPDHVLVMGQSRGGEAALLLGAYYPDIVHGVIAGVPSSAALPGLTDGSVPGWTWRGKPLPTADWPGAIPAITDPSAIPVERITGPILMNCGGNDGLWPSCDFMTAVQARLTARKFRHPVTALRYPEAGHFVGRMMAYRNCSEECFRTHGGTAEANHTALLDNHAKLLKLLSSL